MHFDGGKLSGLHYSFYGCKEGHYRTKGPFVMFMGHIGVPTEEARQSKA